MLTNDKYIQADPGKFLHDKINDFYYSSISKIYLGRLDRASNYEEVDALPTVEEGEGEIEEKV